MIKKTSFLDLLLIVSMCVAETNCSRMNRTSSEKGTDSSASISTERPSAEQDAPRRLNQKAPGAGRVQGLPPGRGRGRGRGRYNPVTISDSEQEAIEIQTVKASFKSMRNLHHAMGKVLAPQTKTAIVSYAFPA